MYFSVLICQFSQLVVHQCVVGLCLDLFSTLRCHIGTQSAVLSIREFFVIDFVITCVGC